MNRPSLRRLACALIILPAFAASTIARAQSEIWLAPRTDGVAGTGSPDNPYDAGTAEKFDRLIGGYYRARKTPMTFHLEPGHYYTLGHAAGWACLSNWKFHGAGMDSTVIQLSGFTYGNNDPSASNAVFVRDAWFQTGVEITDLTIDCSWLNFGSTLMGSFTVPRPGHTVRVSVANSVWARVGKYAYLQRTDTHQEIGFFKVKAVTDGTSLLLENSQSAESLPYHTVVSGPVHVGPSVNTCGIDIVAKNCLVQRVHVTNSGVPVYEGCVGIIISHLNVNPVGDPFYLADGNVIRDCVIDNLWGAHGWCIAVISNNPDPGRDRTFISATVEDNVIHSDGIHHQGLSSWGTANSVWSGNTVTDCPVGWFVDVGYNKDARITGNSFLNDATGIQLGGGYRNGWMRFNISGNHILVPQNGTGILLNGQVHQSVLANNQILVTAGVTAGSGIRVNPDHTDSNIYSNNLVSPVLNNSMPSSTGSAFNNITITGSPIKTGK